MERDVNLIANSGAETPFTQVDDELERLPAIANPDPKIRGLAEKLQVVNAFQTISHETDFQFEL